MASVTDTKTCSSIARHEVNADFPKRETKRRDGRRIVCSGKQNTTRRYWALFSFLIHTHPPPLVVVAGTRAHFCHTPYNPPRQRKTMPKRSRSPIRDTKESLSYLTRRQLQAKAKVRPPSIRGVSPLPSTPRWHLTDVAVVHGHQGQHEERSHHRRNRPATA